MRTLVFSGDRSSKTIALGKFLRKIGVKVKIQLWDGYSSNIYWD